jgi:hypothetical protein
LAKIPFLSLLIAPTADGMLIDDDAFRHLGRARGKPGSLMVS